MTSLNLVHPSLREWLELNPTIDFTSENYLAIRENRWSFAIDARRPVPEDVVREERWIPGHENDPDVRVLLYRPKEHEKNRPAILHIHGGGYVIGLPEGNELSNILFAKSLGAVVVSVDYRLAPEVPFPGPLDDCYAALAWMHNHADELGIDTSRIAVAGESAGGGLAAGLSLLARDRGDYPICFQNLLFPMIDDRTAVRTDIPRTQGEFIWTRASNHFGWSAYLGQAPGGGDISPYAAAARANDFSGLPPTLMITGTMDLFFEENLDYLSALSAASVPCDFHAFSGAPHGFPMWPKSPLTKDYVNMTLEGYCQAFGIG